ncbi:AMP-binding protein, partial [Vibrio parahaemolyticus]|nr:AMP-binding protein [Vibrio parahaemolyticus]
VPVPIYPAGRRSQLEDHLRRQAKVLSNAQARFLVTDDEVRPLARLVGNLVDSLDEIVTHANLASADPVTAPVPVKAGDTALIQYTSGSTSDPKGVVLSHANLLANIRAMGTAIDASSRDVVVSWLPLYHDMGLIGAWLAPLYFRACSVILSPQAFLSDPKRWLWSLHQYRGTISAAPNFAYELCLKSIRDDDIAGLDLSSVRYLMNGAEPVNPSTVVRFAERFAPYGLKPEALAPVYGLAESSVGLAFPPLSRAPIIDRVDRGALTGQGWARPAEPHDRSPLEFVACGRPLPGHDVRIVDEAGHVVPERREGRLQFRGLSATAGYFRNPEMTRALLAGEWLESGDRAYVALIRRFAPNEHLRLWQVEQAAQAAKGPTGAIGDVLYHHPTRRRLQDDVSCIRQRGTL